MSRKLSLFLKFAENGNDLAGDPPFDHLERLHRRVLWTEHDAAILAPQSFHCGLVLGRVVAVLRKL